MTAGNTPLHLALKYSSFVLERDQDKYSNKKERSHKEIAKLLIQHGALLEIRNCYNRSVLETFLKGEDAQHCPQYPQYSGAHVMLRQGLQSRNDLESGVVAYTREFSSSDPVSAC